MGRVTTSGEVLCMENASVVHVFLGLLMNGSGFDLMQKLNKEVYDYPRRNFKAIYAVHPFMTKPCQLPSVFYMSPSLSSCPFLLIHHPRTLTFHQDPVSFINQICVSSTSRIRVSLVHHIPQPHHPFDSTSLTQTSSVLQPLFSLLSAYLQ